MISLQHNMQRSICGLRGHGTPIPALPKPGFRTARVPGTVSSVQGIVSSPSMPNPAQVVCFASSNNTAGGSHAGYAFLHDFCMTLPYGTLALVAGVIFFFLGQPLSRLAAPLATLGALTLVMAVGSLKTWKQGKSSARYTLVAAGVAGGAAYVLMPFVSGGVVGWTTGVLAGLSAAAALFCLYNVLAGGNPPKKGSH